MADPIFISDLISKINDGNIRIPSFQRGFVWDSDRISHLMDSIYKGFPFGTILLWRTKTPLNTDKKLGPYELPGNDPDYPIDYVLDGQQRATSIFGVFQNALTPSPGEDASSFEIYFDLAQEASVQDSNFIYVSPNEFDPDRHFPLKILFDSAKYRNFLKRVPDEFADKVDLIYKRFTTTPIPVQTFTTDDRTAVAIVFERINRLGVELDTLQLLSAWTWNEDFDLQEEFADLAEELGPFGFRDVGEDSDLLLRCCAAILSGEASPKAIINLQGNDVRSNFKKIKNGIIGAVDFLRNNFDITSANVLPFPSIIIPLSVYFSTDKDQSTYPSLVHQKILEKWVWRTFFSRRYSKRLEQLNSDTKEIQKLKDNQPNNLGDFHFELSEDFFLKSQFNVNTANSKTFILMLSLRKPKNFTNGAPVSIGNVLKNCNKKEFHHVYPRKYLIELGLKNKEINPIANFAVISRADNNILGGVKPSQYKLKMPSDNESIREIMESAICPENTFNDNYEKFLSSRAKMLIENANQLMGY